jgi:hypothetical protein
MHFGVFFYGTVDMPDAGVDGPPAHQRQYSQADYRRVYADLLAYAQHCDALGYDSMWTAEHHFHQHGFEVVPNVVRLNAVLAQHTRRIRLGALIHVLTTWHPLHFAEDYALADVAGAAALCRRGPKALIAGVWRQRWLPGCDRRPQPHGLRGTGEVFKAATAHGRSLPWPYYTIPPEGLTFRGERITTLPLNAALHTPVHLPTDGSEATLHYAARQRHVGVFANHPGSGWWPGGTARRYGRGDPASGAEGRLPSSPPGRLGGAAVRAPRGQAGSREAALAEHHPPHPSAGEPPTLHARGAYGQPVVDRGHA